MNQPPSMEAFLRKRVADLELQVEALKQAIHGLDETTPILPVLSPDENILIGILRKRAPNMVHRSSIMEAMYALRARDETPTTKILDVYICRARRKLKPLGIEIRTAWGRGYSMDAASAARWDQEAGHVPQS